MKQLFAGLDVHKKTIQISVMDKDGVELLNQSIPNTPESVFESFGKFSKNTKIVMESSSVYKSVFFQLRDTMGFDVTLSNPYTTKMIAQSKKKTDKIDARILADLNRGNYLVECYVPTRKAMQNRDLTRFRRTLVQHRTGLVNSIHGILLQNRISPKHTRFSQPWIKEIRAIGVFVHVSLLHNSA